MRFLLDENVPREIGADSEDDPIVFETAPRRRAVVVTYDSDFGDERTFASHVRCGIIRLRRIPSNAETTEAVLGRVFDEIHDLDITERLLIADRHRTRIV